ncbi:flagellin hook IN motif-containing protein, partial [Aquabacterium sp. A08]|uniref:flagellin N-terminal helical domain-containing protein n=1 Tax=Aquabacterium sp. A08 TaxID=2718532 RepID=UPI00142232CC
GDILQRVRELAVQSANASNSASDRQALQAEVGQLVAELDRISQTTEFNGQKLLDGSFGTAQFQVGANANQTIVATTANLRTSVYGNNQVNASGPVADATTLGDNTIVGGTITVNGYLGSKEVEIDPSVSMQTVASKINQVAGETGVTATARTDVKLEFEAGSFTIDLSTGVKFDDTDALDVTLLEPRSISFKVTDSTPEGLAEAISAFNEQSSRTGVTAALSADNEGIVLTSASGDNVNIQLVAADLEDDTATVALSVLKLDANGNEQATAVEFLEADAGATEAVTNFVAVAGNLVLDSQKSFSVLDDATATGLFSATDGAFVNADGDNIDADSLSSELQKVADLDITTFSNASEALKTVDSALAFISGERAKLGAL